MNMARGGYHGGGFHSGGHHGGGGGFHGGGYHRSGRSHYHHSYGNSSSSSEEGIATGILIRMGCYTLLLLILMIRPFVENFSSYNVINSIMMIVAVGIFFYSFAKRGRVLGVRDALNATEPLSFDSLCDTDDDVFYKSGEKSDGTSWYDDKHFKLHFIDKNFRISNAITAMEEIKKWPFIMKIPDFYWVIFSCVWFVVNFFFYEAVIPCAENSIMSDAAFHFVDELVFYFPAIMILLNSVALLVISKVRLRLLRKLCIKIVTNNIDSGKIENVSEEIIKEESDIWFHNECPNCAALARVDDTRCHSCGTSLRILIPDNVPSDRRHRKFSIKKKNN